MVTISDYAKRKNSNGEEFFVLMLQGGLELVMSKKTGRYYGTVKKASLPTTFNEETCKMMLGQQIPGAIMKVACDPYEFTIPETGEIIVLQHRWEYRKEEASIEEAVFEGKLQGVHA